MKHIEELRRCPSCERINRRERMALCRSCWRAASTEARRAHWRVHNAVTRGTASIADLLASIERLANAARTARFGLQLPLGERQARAC